MLENIRRWQWILLSIVIGLLIGLVRSHFDEASVVGQSVFPNKMEDAVIKFDKAEDGRLISQFHSLRVRKFNAPDTKYVVMGKHFWKKQDGFMLYHDRFCVTDVVFKPTPGKLRGTKEYEPTWRDKAQRWAEKLKLKEPDPPGTVLDWLRKVQANEGIEFRYEWWRQPRVSMAMWTAASFVVIGLVWPTVINVILFGSIFRPPGEAGIWGLRKVSARTRAAAQKRGLTEAELERIRAMGDALEADLMAGATPGDHAPAPQSAPAPVKPLAPEPVTASSKPGSTPSSKAIGMDQDDFYPTEVHAKPPKNGE